MLSSRTRSVRFVFLAVLAALFAVILALTAQIVARNLGMLRDPHKYFDNVSACSLCCSCDNVCPAKVDLAEQIYRWRQNLDDLGKANPTKKFISKSLNFVYSRPGLYTTALKFAPIINHMPRFLVYSSVNAWGIGRELPRFAKESFNAMWTKGEIQQGKEEKK